MDRMIDALGRLSGRERWLLALLLAVVGPLALGLLWLAPLAETRKAALERLSEARALQVWVQGRAAEKALIVAVAAPEKHPPIGASGLEQSLISADLRGALSSLSDLGDGVALLTYRSAEVGDDGEAARHALRTSLWVRGRDGWQIRFHQGTPTGPFVVRGDG